MIGPKDKITKKEMWKSFIIVHYETDLGFKFYEVRRGEAYLNTFQLRQDAKRYIDRINEQYKKEIDEMIAKYVKILFDEIAESMKRIKPEGKENEAEAK